MFYAFFILGLHGGRAANPVLICAAPFPVYRKTVKKGDNLIICSSSIGMESTRTYTSVRMDANGLNNSGGIGSFLSSLMNEGRLADNSEENTKTDETDDKTVSLGKTLEDIRNRYESMKTESLGSRSKLERDAMDRIRAQCLQFLLRLLFGRKSALDDANEQDYAMASSGSSKGESTNFATVSMTMTNVHYYEEHEDTTFTTTGKVITASGKEIDFDLELSMSRSFCEYYEENYTMEYALTDPLVINLDTDIAEFGSQKFRFDIDSDGAVDEIAKLSSKSGYLALDLNGDGIINDGSELFGTKSGDGFRDLAAYDSDKNGWIDEADDVWKALRIYVQNEDGSESLYYLADKGVGAIYLGNVRTEFSENEMQSNETNAVVRRTGIFLYENGNVGTIQHVDVAKAEYSA